jgi:predicted Fe-Mo cluster-binding NifX family protein
MKIAIPLFEKRISPHFDYAPALLLVLVDRGEIVHSHELALEQNNTTERISYLKTFGVDTLICGGISSEMQQLIAAQNITVIPWVTGEAQEALQLFLRGRLDPGTILCPGRKRRWHFCTRQGGRGNRRN